MRISILFLFLTGISCTTAKHIVNIQTLDFGLFTISTPDGWTKIKLQGVDDFVGRIAVDKQDTLEFNLGFFANPLQQHDEPEDYYGNNPGKFLKSKITWTFISGRKAKILTPKKYGIGMTGIYFDSLWTVDHDIIKFNLMGENLKKENEQALITALQTIRFRQGQ